MNTDITKRLLILTILTGSLVLTACEDNDEAPAVAQPAYIRVFDIQHGEDYITRHTALSVFSWDGAFYGNAALDSVKVPKYEVKNFGDFFLGRTRKLYNNS